MFMCYVGKKNSIADPIDERSPETIRWNLHIFQWEIASQNISCFQHWSSFFILYSFERGRTIVAVSGVWWCLWVCFIKEVRVSHGREREKRTVLGFGKMTHSQKFRYHAMTVMGIHIIHYSRGFNCTQAR